MGAGVRLVAVERVADGAELARDVMGAAPGGPPLMCAGLRLAPPLLARASACGVAAVWVDDELGEGIAPPEPLSPAIRSAALRTIVRAHAEAGRALSARRPFDLRVLAELAGTADAIVRADAGEPVDPCEPRPADPHGHWHALRVTTLGLAMGSRQLRTFGWLDHTQSPRFDRIDERLANFGSGLMLHDIGKLALPEALRHDSGSRTPEQQKAFERHADAGASVLPDSMVPVPVRVVVRSHHERWDGSGFPQGKTGEAIHQFARIAAVADAYDAVTRPREGCAAVSRQAALDVIAAGAATQFDPAAVVLLQEIVPAHAVGHEVRLADGRLAVIAHIDAEHRSRLTVRVAIGERRVEEFSIDGTGELADRAA